MKLTKNKLIYVFLSIVISLKPYASSEISIEDTNLVRETNTIKKANNKTIFIKEYAYNNLSKYLVALSMIITGGIYFRTNSQRKQLSDQISELVELKSKLEQENENFHLNYIKQINELEADLIKFQEKLEEQKKNFINASNSDSENSDSESELRKRISELTDSVVELKNKLLTQKSNSDVEIAQHINANTTLKEQVKNLIEVSNSHTSELHQKIAELTELNSKLEKDRDAEIKMKTFTQNALGFIENDHAAGKIIKVERGADTI